MASTRKSVNSPMAGRPHLTNDAADIPRNRGAARGDASRRVTIAEVADEIRLDCSIREECSVDAGIVEAAHRPAIQSQRAGGEDHVAALQGRIAEGVLLDHGRLAGKPVPRIGVVREQLDHLLVEFEVIADDHRDRGGQRLGAGCCRSIRSAPSLAFASGDFTNTKRAGVVLAAVGPNLDQIGEPVQACRPARRGPARHYACGHR